MHTYIHTCFHTYLHLCICTLIHTIILGDIGSIITKPYIFWAYYLIKEVLLINRSSGGTALSQPPNRLLNVLFNCCRSNNASLRYCVHDLVTIIATYRNISATMKDTLRQGMNSTVRDKKMLIEFSERYSCTCLYIHTHMYSYILMYTHTYSYIE